MIVEFYALKVAFLSSFITWFIFKSWINYNKCKCYEIKEIKILKRRE
jgi:hypothetical protein